MVNLFNYVNKSTFCLVLSVLIYFIISKVIFDNVYLTSNMVVDEEFHVPLGQSYCKRAFNLWDPKVTTLPGLYLVSIFILLPFGTCSTYSLRFVSLVASVVNIFLFYDLFSRHDLSKWRNILSSITLALLPPLYFFSHLYYTDVTALTMILVMLVLSERGYHFVASVFGFFSVVCRQSNIIWVTVVAAKYVLTEFSRIALRRSSAQETGRGIPANNLKQFVMHLSRRPKHILLNTSIQFWLDVSAYGSVLLTFILFIILNGSIVVGDKSAHEAMLHLPQLFYYSLFCMIFAWPHFVGEVINFTVFAKRNKLLIFSCTAVCMLVIFVNTLVHPYMLADNRHYLFYVWNRFYREYTLFRYLMVPVYVFAWYVIIKIMYDANDIIFFILYMPSVFLVLATQQLIDFRYYFVPYMIFRLHFKNTASTEFNVILEFVTFCIVNAITLNLYFTKTIVWDDYEIPQRLIW